MYKFIISNFKFLTKSKLLKSKTGKRKIYSGFTLIEIIIALTIIAILAVIALAAYDNQTAKALDAKRKDDLARIQIAIEEYEKDHNCYPAPALLDCINDPAGLAPYLDKIPCDPVTKASYYYDTDNNPACSSWFRLFTSLTGTTGSPIGPGGSFNYSTGSPNAPAAQLTQVQDLYGCKGGFCVAIYFNNKTKNAECVPHFSSSNCNNQCGNPGAICKPVN